LIVVPIFNPKFAQSSRIRIAHLKAPLISGQRYMEKENLTDGAEFTKRLEPTGLTFEWR
jgi:hypothetical protein